METKAKKVTLIVKEGDATRSQTFEHSHAERLLKRPNNGGWVLPNDSEYELTKTNGLILRASKGVNQKP